MSLIKAQHSTKLGSNQLIKVPFWHMQSFKWNHRKILSVNCFKLFFSNILRVMNFWAWDWLLMHSWEPFPQEWINNFTKFHVFKTELRGVLFFNILWYWFLNIILSVDYDGQGECINENKSIFNVLYNAMSSRKYFNNECLEINTRVY